MTPLVVRGVGVVSPLGIGWDAWCEGLARAAKEPELGFRATSEVLSAERVPGAVVAEVSQFDAAEYLGAKGLRNLDRLTRFLVVAVRLALHHSGVKRDGRFERFDAESIGLCSSTAYGSLEAITETNVVAELEDPRYLNPSKFPNTVINTSAGYASIWEDLRGPNVKVVDGNCGGLDVVLTAETHFNNGRAKAFLLGGTEVLSEPLYLAFRRLEILAEKGQHFAPGRSDSEGVRIGEGSAYVLVEPLAAEGSLAGQQLGVLRGYGTAFEPPESEAQLAHGSATAVERAIRGALADAQRDASNIDLVCASFGGVVEFDRAEAEAIRRVFPEGTPVAAPKTYYGETFGAGGALALAAALAWMNGVDVSPLVHGRLAAPPRSILVVAAGYYGNVSAVVVDKP